MTESQGNAVKMSKQKREHGVIAVTGAAALLALAVKLGITAFKLSPEEQKEERSSGRKRSIPLDKVTYMNVISPLAELEAQQFPLFQSCVFPKMVSTCDDVRKASAEAERRIDAHVLICSKREDVYRVVKAFATRGEWVNAEAKNYTQALMRDFERNGTRTLRGWENKKIVAVEYGKRCGEVNLSILEDLVQLRHKFARLLGYSNYADYAVDLRMAKTPAKVFEFLEDISNSLADSATIELSMLKDLKKKEEGDYPFGVEDLLYYVKKAEEQQFNFDFGDLKQYFPVNLVLSGVFKIAQDLFGLSSGELLGHFYLDLYTREGKYSHTCVVALQNGALSSNGSRQIPIALLISQFEKDVSGHPALLRFSEVVNLFHEFGHVVQHICNRASFSKFSGLGFDPDFVEVPAQVLENWCYESFSLKLISGFHQDITKPIKDEMCKSIKRWRYSFSALKMKQEILYCLFDQIIYSAENVDILELFKHLHPRIMLGLPALEGVNPASRFPCSAIGYEASCYSRIGVSSGTRCWPQEDQRNRWKL
ncbi:hypothetical protein M0R45_021595 [Rubus argutus]|uniref:Peptidase M3A/M3B catalytic domain-containing protein n=1 Tax=Rubus argutus TaxID=59490 RepID=A0AAW1XDH9_RUBAR